MRTRNRSASRKSRTHLARLLAGALLIGIVYAVTFGSAHSHVNAASRLVADSVATSAGQASSAFVSTAETGSHKYECLVCLFHQQLFSSTASEPIFLAKPAIAIEAAPAEDYLTYTDPFTSARVARLSGRAPPVA